MLPSRGQCGSGGCGRPSQCSDQSHLASSSTVPSGGSELLSRKLKWPPYLTTICLPNGLSVDFCNIAHLSNPVVLVEDKGTVSASQ